MRRIIIYSMLLISGFISESIYAQKAYLGEIYITQDRFEQQGDSLYIAMRIDLSGVSVASRQTLVLTPVLKGESVSIELPKVVIHGTNKDKVYRRMLAMNKKKSFDMPYTVLKVKDRTNEQIAYKIRLPYEASWMNGAVLGLKEDFYGCAGKRRLISVNMLPCSLTLKEGIPSPVPETILLEPESLEKEKPVILRRDGTAYLDFPVGQSRIMVNFRGNAEELDKIDFMLDSLIYNKNIDIKSIDLTGYASPEGTYAMNMQLSQKRVEAFRDYLCRKYSGLPYRLYHVDWKGEDWESLYRMVQESDMPARKDVLSIIRHVGIHEGREKMLMDLDGGIPYRYMKERFFPKLRRVYYKIFYEILPGRE
ncbi:MAG: DUF3868 domain-containing protein [Bacteroidales bacterium]|nr:DUF3868 domain-containing protein [Bacteroidales bacterium]